MKKILVLFLTIIMTFSITITAYAADPQLSVSDASAKQTKMVYGQDGMMHFLRKKAEKMP